MTILNVRVHRDFAIAIADSAYADEADRSRTGLHASKLFPLPHMNALLAVRGSFALGTCLYTFCNGAGLGDFDTLAAAMPLLLESARANMLKAAGEHIAVEAGRDAVKLEIESCGETVLLGWSPVRGRCWCYEWGVFPGRTDVERMDIDSRVAPWAEDWGPAPAPRNSEDLLSIARQQARLSRQHPQASRCAWGGRFVVAQVTATRIMLETVSESS